MGKTHTNPFTREQMDHLRVNHYVKSISRSAIRFTEEFKKYFYEKYHSGMTVRQIFTECGIDPDMPGESRIEGFRYTLDKQAKRDSGFTDNRSSNCRRLMSKYNLFCPIRKANPYRRMAQALKTVNYAPNIVNRDFHDKGYTSEAVAYKATGDTAKKLK